MTAGAISIDGLDMLNKQLAQLDNATSGKTLYKAVSAGLAVIQKDAKARAPKSRRSYRRYMSHRQDGKKRAKRGEGKYQVVSPGLLKKSIKRRRLTKGRSRKQDGVTGAIYVAYPARENSFNTPYYWYFIEYGTKRAPAQPFLRPAFASQKDEAVNAFKSTLADAVATALSKK